MEEILPGCNDKTSEVAREPRHRCADLSCPLVVI
jgi:hypothetical protein